MLSAGAALIGILVGALAASVVLLGWSRSRVHSARSEREKLLGDAQREAEALRREAQVEAREAAVALRSEIETEVQDRRVQIAKVEEFSEDPVLKEVLTQVANGQLEAQSAQAAAWHITDKMSWKQLAAKSIPHLGGREPTPYFSAGQLDRARRMRIGRRA